MGGGGLSEIWKFCRKFRRLCPPPEKCFEWISATAWLNDRLYDFFTRSSLCPLYIWSKIVGLRSTNYIIITNYRLVFYRFEEAFITTHLKGATQHLWTGMNNLHRYYNYFWVDNSIVNYLKWNTREPRWGSNRCIEIVPYRWAAGRWNAVYCSKMNGYICKKGSFVCAFVWHRDNSKNIKHINNTKTCGTNRH
jgi:hypothetical protein